MPFYTSLLSLLILTCAGCEKAAVNYGFEIDDVNLRIASRKLNVSLRQELRFSVAARRALNNGVPLLISVDLELRDASTLTLLAEERVNYEVRYLPLSQRYQLSTPDGKKELTYPRLRHVIRKLSMLNLAFQTGPLAPGDYEFRVRTKLDRANLPAPMQLPAMLSGKWQHDSDWSQWPFQISV